MIRTCSLRSAPKPTASCAYLTHKQADGDGVARDLTGQDRCVLCRHPFGTKYADPFFGAIEIRRNRLNRNYCNQCNFFIRICPGQATLIMPVLVADVRESRSIRAQVADLREYSQLLTHFQRRVSAEVQQNFGFVLHTFGDTVLAVWPSGFIPPHIHASDLEDGSLATVSALRRIAPAHFSGDDLPFHAAVDTTEMVIFAVSASETNGGFAAFPADDTGEPLEGAALFTRANVTHPTYRAFAELGKAVKTCFLADYLASEMLRREIHEDLNVVENWNSANGFICYGNGGELATNRRENQELAVLCLHLIQASLVYINTLISRRSSTTPPATSARR